MFYYLFSQLFATFDMVDTSHHYQFLGFISQPLYLPLTGTFSLSLVSFPALLLLPINPLSKVTSVPVHNDFQAWTPVRLLLCARGMGWGWAVFNEDKCFRRTAAVTAK